MHRDARDAGSGHLALTGVHARSEWLVQADKIVLEEDVSGSPLG